MKKDPFRKILQNHFLAMVICCAIPLIAISVLSFLGILGSWGFYALMLLCPILHLLMMRGHTLSADDAKGHTPSVDDVKGLIPSPDVAKDQQRIKEVSTLSD